MAGLYKFWELVEVWGSLIPIFVLLKFKKQPEYFKPIIIYVWAALILSLVCDAFVELQSPNPPIWVRVNTYLYNLHSIIRFFLFSLFFIKLNQPFLRKIKRVFPALFLLFIIFNFGIIKTGFEEPFFNYWYDKTGELQANISSRLFTVEAGLLITYCLQYYLYKMSEDLRESKKTPDFWIVTGLSIYAVANFFFFLFYKTLYNESTELVNILWDFSNLPYLILCIFIAKAFYASRNR